MYASVQKLQVGKIKEFLKEVPYADQICIYLIENTVMKTEILSNIIRK